MLRSGLISAIYDQTLLLQAQDLGDATAITLMGTDVERIVVNLKNIHESWASILEVGIAIWLLERQLWVACVVPVVICFGRTLSWIN
jgi:ATP-binding cassette subfamily C (CFTR/MRP) protein 1